MTRYTTGLEVTVQGYESAGGALLATKGRKIERVDFGAVKQHKSASQCQ